MSSSWRKSSYIRSAWAHNFPTAVLMAHVFPHWINALRVASSAKNRAFAWQIQTNVICMWPNWTQRSRGTTTNFVLKGFLTDALQTANAHNQPPTATVSTDLPLAKLSSLRTSSVRILTPLVPTRRLLDVLTDHVLIFIMPAFRHRWKQVMHLRLLSGGETSFQTMRTSILVRLYARMAHAVIDKKTALLY